MEPIEGSETSAFKPQTSGKYPKENILYIKSFHIKDVRTHEHQIRKMFGFLTLEVRTDMLSRNVGEELPLLAE